MPGPANDLNISQSGIVVFDGTSEFVGRTLIAGTGITITDGDGVSANPVITSTAAATDLHVARFIVASSTGGTGANFTTIAAAIASAQGTGIPATVFIQPGTYTENFTLPANINLCAFDCDAQTPNVTIVGTITCNDAGSRSISGINLQTNSANSIVVSGSSATILNLVNCNFNIANNTAISYTTASASSSVKLLYCTGNISAAAITLFSASGTGRLAINFCKFTNTGLATTASTMSAGTLDIHWSQFDFPITTSGTNTWGSTHNEYNTNVLNATSVTFGGSGTSSSSKDYYASGTATAIVVSTVTQIDSATVISSNTNAISGASSITFGSLTFANSSSIISTTTQVPSVQSNDAIKVVTPGAYPYTTTCQDAIIKVDTSAARTIIPLASPTTGQKHIIKDTVGTAGANNITVTPSGKNIDGSASFTINTNYGSITIIYTGSEWSVT